MIIMKSHDVQYYDSHDNLSDFSPLCVWFKGFIWWRWKRKLLWFKNQHPFLQEYSRATVLDFEGDIQSRFWKLDCRILENFVFFRNFFILLYLLVFSICWSMPPLTGKYCALSIHMKRKQIKLLSKCSYIYTQSTTLTCGHLCKAIMPRLYETGKIVEGLLR